MPRLYAATGNSIATLTAGGGRWSVSVNLAESAAQCVAFTPSDPSVLYAGSRGRGLWRSRDGGRSWEDTRLPHNDVFSVAVSPVDGTVYAGCEPSMLFASADGGASWRELASLRDIPSAPRWSFPPRPWTSHVRWIAPSPHDAGRLLVGIELGGVMASADGGETWSDHPRDAQPDVHALAWHPRTADRVYEAGGGGTAWSRDGGRTWERVDDGRDRHYTWALAVDPEDPDRWYVSATFGPLDAHGSRPARARIYRWLGDGPWQALDGGLPDPLPAMPYALVIAEGTLYAGLRDGRLLSSSDGGDTWNQLELAGDPLPSIVALVAAPAK